MKESIETLLSQVSTITKKYEDIAKATGENFNVFSILGLSTSEVRTHSRMIAELLNPFGSHDMGDVFLKLFIENVLVDNEEKRRKYLDKTIHAKVLVEKFLGNINDENYTGGYIDILIEFPNSDALIIENKIYAGDQNAQLRRYYNYNKKAELIYLTLNGDSPSDASTLNSNKALPAIEPLCPSYKENIINWLEACKKEAVNHPLFRETITQYIYLNKQLTQQAMNNEMEKEVLELIVNSKKYTKAVFNFPKQEKIIEEIINKLKGRIEESIVFKSLELSVKFNDNYPLLVDGQTDFWFFKKGWSYCIVFSLERKNEPYEMMNIYIGNLYPEIIGDAEKIKSITQRLNDVSFGYPSSYENGNWSCYFKKWELTKYWEILDQTPKDIEDILTEIISKLEGVEM